MDPEEDVERTLEAAVPMLDPQLRMPLRYDLVNKINDYETIARRYGFGDATGLIKFLQANPDFTAEVAKLKALFSSDMSAQERGRLKAAIASEELVADIAGIVANPSTGAGTRIDGFKQLNRMAGVDGIPPSSKDGTGPSGTQFTINFQFAGRTETLTTTVVENEAIPALEDSSSDAPDEEV